MPVLMTGAMLVSTTLRISMPVGTPRKSSEGSVHSGFSPAVISYIVRVKFNASIADPAPTNPATAGEAAIANPPRPIVSMMVESPMSGFASFSE